MAATYSLTLRSDLNRKLTIEEMDNNFLYLDNKSGGSASATLPIVTNLGTGTASYNQGNNFLGLGLTYSGQVFDTGSGGYNVMVSVDGTAADDAKDLNFFGYFDPNNAAAANIATRYDSDFSNVNISASSLTFSAEIVVGASTTYSTSFVKFRFYGITQSQYTFPTTDPSPGEVLGYESANHLGWVSGSQTTIAGSNSQIQFNNNGSLGADSGLFYDGNLSIYKSTGMGLLGGIFTPRIGVIPPDYLSNGGYYYQINSPTGMTNSLSWTLPENNGYNGDTLATNGAGKLSWTASSYLSLDGGSMNTGAGIYFGGGGQNIAQGTFDNGYGGDKGISLTCAIGYELNWQAGRLSNYYGGTYSPITIDSNLQILSATFGGTYIEPYELAIGQSGNANFIAGDDVGAYLKLKTGSEGVGKVWTSDQSGWGSWVDIQPYKKYVALITQSGTATPTTIELENTIGVSPVITYMEPGSYLLSWAGASPSLVTLDKMWAVGCPIDSPPPGSRTVAISPNGADSEVSIDTKLGGIGTDEMLTKYSIEVRIYN